MCRDQPPVNKIAVIAVWICSLASNEEIEIYVRTMFIQNPRGAALHSILIQDTMFMHISRGAALHSILILEVLHDVTLEVEGGACPQLMVARAPLPVDYRRLKTDHTSVFKHQLLSPPRSFLLTGLLPPSSTPHTHIIRREHITNCV